MADELSDLFNPDDEEEQSEIAEHIEEFLNNDS